MKSTLGSQVLKKSREQPSWGQRVHSQKQEDPPNKSFKTFDRVLGASQSLSKSL